MGDDDDTECVALSPFTDNTDGTYKSEVEHRSPDAGTTPQTGDGARGRVFRTFYASDRLPVGITYATYTVTFTHICGRSPDRLTTQPPFSSMMVDDDVFISLDASRDISINITATREGLINPCEGTQSQSITATLRNTKGGKLRAVKTTLDLRTTFWAGTNDGFTGDSTFTDTGQIKVVRTTG